MYIPKWLLSLFTILFLLLLSWTCALVMQRNPLPFPDTGSRFFSTPSAEAKAAVVALLARHSITEPFRADSDGVLRSIMWHGVEFSKAYYPSAQARKPG